MTKQRVKRVWMLMLGETIIGDGYWGLDIYPTEKDATACRKANGMEKDWDVVPVKLSYRIPRKVKK